MFKYISCITIWGIKGSMQEDGESKLWCYFFFTEDLTSEYPSEKCSSLQSLDEAKNLHFSLPWEKKYGFSFFCSSKTWDTNALIELQVFHMHDWRVSTQLSQLSPPVNYQKEILHNSVAYKH